MGQQIQQVLQMLTKEQEESKKLKEENKRLQELLEKNKIDYALKPITPPAPPETKK